MTDLMDVTLPNGETLYDVPTGVSDKAIMKEALRLGAATTRDFYPTINIPAKADEAVRKMADKLGPIDRFSIGLRESIRTAAGRINEVLGLEGENFISPEQAQRERELTRHVTGPSALSGRVLPTIATTARVPGGVAPSGAAGVATGYLTADDPITGALLGGAGGVGGTLLGSLLGRAAKSYAGKWAERTVQGTDDTANTLRQFQEMGGRLTPSQASGKPVSRMLDNAMTSNPVTAGAYRTIADKNKRMLTTLAAKAIGVNSDDLGPTALRAADDFLSNQFDDVAKRIKEIPVDTAMVDDITRLLRKGDVKPHLEALAVGKLSGRAYMNLRSKLLKVTRSTKDTADEAWDTIDDLDEIVEGLAPEGYKEAYAAARERYKTLLALDKYRRGVTGGEVNAQTLEGAIEKVFGKQYTRNLSTRLPETKELFTAVRALADPRMAAHLGGSPTAERLMPWLALTGGLLNPAIAGTAGALHVGSRALLAAPAPVASQIGGVAGRLTPNIFVRTIGYETQSQNVREENRTKITTGRCSYCALPRRQE